MNNFAYETVPFASLATVPAPVVTSITGYSDGGGVSAGRWTGQPSHAPAWASNRYKGFLASDSFNYGSAASNPYDWDINGSNFGSQGTVSISPLPTPFTNVTIVSWTASKIRIKAVAYPGYQSSVIYLKVTTSTGSTSNTFADRAVGIIKSRGCFQCPWLVAKTRLERGLSVPPTAYSTTAAIPAVGAADSGYRPAQWDCLTYDRNHVAIITSTPTPVNNPDGSLTLSFTVTESNANWDEAISTSTRTYKLSKANSLGKRTVLSGIGTNASTSWVATGYFR